MSVTLRAPKPEDVADRLTIGQAPEVVRMFGGDPNALPALTEGAAKKWVDSLAAHPHAWVVEHEGRLLGEIRLDDLDEHDRRARLAVGLFDPTKLGKGLGREAIRLVLKHAFGELGLHRISLRRRLQRPGDPMLFRVRLCRGRPRARSRSRRWRMARRRHNGLAVARVRRGLGS